MRGGCAAPRKCSSISPAWRWAGGLVVATLFWCSCPMAPCATPPSRWPPRAGAEPGGQSQSLDALRRLPAFRRLLLANLQERSFAMGRWWRNAVRLRRRAARAGDCRTAPPLRVIRIRHLDLPLLPLPRHRAGGVPLLLQAARHRAVRGGTGLVHRAADLARAARLAQAPQGSRHSRAGHGAAGAGGGVGIRRAVAVHGAHPGGAVGGSTAAIVRARRRASTASWWSPDNR